VSAAKRLGKSGALAFVIAAVALFIFIMFKVPLYGAYKITSGTFTIFKRIFWVGTAVLGFIDFLDFWRKPSEDKPQRRDRLRPRVYSTP
jgi:hypothetical protein